MRLLVTGKTQSGKTTALHRLLMHALRLTDWQGVLILDGKGHLSPYRDLNTVTYLGPDQLEAWAFSLAQLAEAVPGRYQALLQAGLYEAPADTARYLILVDEVQKGTRAKKIGKTIREALSTLAEQSAALGDVLITAAQREINAIPPDVRANANAKLSLLGLGYFFYKADGLPTVSGRVSYVEPDVARASLDRPPSGRLLPLTLANVPALLGRIPVQPTRAPAMLYLGPPGSGRTYALRHHPNGATARHLYADLAQPHRTMLVGLIEAAGAMVPARVPIPELAEIAALAIQAEPTLLLLDNLHAASLKTLASVERLMTAAAVVALAADAPSTPTMRRKLERLYPRCEIRELPPLSKQEARALLWQTLNRAALKRPRAVEAKILNEANGNPGVVVKLARRIQRGDARELRQIHTPVKRINVGWVVVVAVIAAALVSRRVLDSYLAIGLMTALAIGLRPFLWRMIRSE